MVTFPPILLARADCWHPHYLEWLMSEVEATIDATLRQEERDACLALVRGALVKAEWGAQKYLGVDEDVHRAFLREVETLRELAEKIAARA